MPPRLDIARVGKVFEDAGCRLISTKYVNQHEPLEYMCCCGSKNTHTIAYKNFIVGQRCADCRQSRREATNLKQHGFARHANNPEMREKMLVGLKEHAEKEKHKYSDVLNYYKEHGCELLAYEYKNNTEKMYFVCRCGRIGYTNYKNFRSGVRCKTTGCRQATKNNTDFSSYTVEYTHMEKQPIKKNFV